MTQDESLAAKFAPLEPADFQVTRGAARVLERFHPERRPLWREWFDFFAARPVVHVGYALAAAVLLGLLSPLSSLPGLMQRTAAPLALISPSPDGKGCREAAGEGCQSIVATVRRSPSSASLLIGASGRSGPTRKLDVAGSNPAGAACGPVAQPGRAPPC